jgi:AraC family transcriptional regulator, arabinose operon regulatory protein
MAKIKSGFKGERAIVLPTPIIADYRNDPLGILLYISDIGCYPKADFHYRRRSKEEVLQYILIYCLEGEGWFELESIRQKVTAHHVFILPKGKAHVYGCQHDNPWTIYWIHFDGEKAGFFAEGMDKPLCISPQEDSRIKERLNLFEEIFSTLKNGYRKDNLAYSSTCLFHFLGSLKYIGAFRESVSSSLQPRDMADEAIHMMRENINKRLTLKEISDYIGLSSSHFSNLFHQKTGFAPLYYFTHLKIQEACHHLDFSNLKINQISMMIGMEDALYFSRCFSKIMGISPSEYRRKKKG